MRRRQMDTGTVLTWYDFLCPFCYIGQHRNAILIRHGLRVIELPFQVIPTFRLAELRWVLALGRCTRPAQPSQILAGVLTRIVDCNHPLFDVHGIFRPRGCQSIRAANYQYS